MSAARDESKLTLIVAEPGSYWPLLPVTRRLADRGGIPFETSPSFGIPEGLESVAANTIPMNVREKATRASAIPYDFLNAAMEHLTYRDFRPSAGQASGSCRISNRSSSDMLRPLAMKPMRDVVSSTRSLVIAA